MKKNTNLDKARARNAELRAEELGLAGEVPASGGQFDLNRHAQPVRKLLVVEMLEITRVIPRSPKPHVQIPSS